MTIIVIFGAYYAYFPVSKDFHWELITRIIRFPGQRLPDTARAVFSNSDIALAIFAIQGNMHNKH